MTYLILIILILNKKSSNTAILDLYLSITHAIVSCKIYDIQDDFNLEIVNFPYFDGDVPLSPSYGVYL